MRKIGLPEPVLLDFLAHKVDQTRNTRGGPRDDDEVRVRAARLLLTYPLPVPPPAKAAPKAAAPAVGSAGGVMVPSGAGRH